MNTNTLSISENGEARILLTDRCNYRCVFCHNEGAEAGQTDEKETSPEHLREVIDRLLERGCRDITFTGGEPLMKKDLLMDLFHHIRKVSPTVPVSIVTNGSLLTSEWVNALAELGGVRFNISLHTVRPEDYSRITAQTHTSLDALSEKLKLLQNADIPFKLNAVALRSTFSDAEDVRELIDYARNAGALSLKIIELLIVEKNQDFFDEHLALDTVKKWLPPSMELRRQISRGVVYGDATFQVELRKCRCHFGCEECLRSQQTDSFDAAGRYWACFERSEEAQDVFGLDFDQRVAVGRRVLTEMKRRYGSDSPSLVKQLQMVPSKREVWFQVDSSLCVNARGQSEEFVQCLSYTGIFFEPEFALPSRELPSVHLRCHQNNPENARLIMGFLSIVEENGLPVHQTRFLDSSRIPMEGDVPFLQKTLLALGWRVAFSATAEESHFKTMDGCRFSIVWVDGKHQFISVDVSTVDGIRFAKQLAKEDELKPLRAIMSEHIRMLV